MLLWCLHESAAACKTSIAGCFPFRDQQVFERWMGRLFAVLGPKCGAFKRCCAVWTMIWTHRWRCHFDFILLAKMTLQRASRKRKSTEDSGENDLGCAKILTEFQILQSLIPQIAGRIDITEVSFSDFISAIYDAFFWFQLEIIDACVDYIESLQNQLSQSGTVCKWPRKESLLTTSTTKLSTLVKRDTTRRHNVRMRWNSITKADYEFLCIFQ